MASSQQKLRHTLGQWRHWQCEPVLQRPPEIVSTLSGGSSNSSVLVRSAQAFVVRIDGVDARRHGLNRQLEWRALQDASAAGLAPTPRYFNPELGSLVCDYLPPDEDQTQQPAQIAALLRRIHRLPARHHKLDILERVVQYEKQLPHPPAFLEREQSDHLHALALRERDWRDEAVLCHNDLLRGNRIQSGGRMWALDWEYCAMAHPLYDLAVVVAGDELPEADSRELFRAYLQRDPDAGEQLALRRFECLYRYLELLWYLSTGNQSALQASLPDKAAKLQRKLDQLPR